MPRGGDDLSDADARLLADLAAALGSDPLPAGLVARATELIAMQHVDAELARLLEDSAGEPVGARGSAVQSAASFQVGDGSVTIEVEILGDVVVGRVHALDVRDITLERPGGDLLHGRVDELGRFTFARLTPGPARLLLRDGERPVRSDWFVI